MLMVLMIFRPQGVLALRSISAAPKGYAGFVTFGG